MRHVLVGITQGLGLFVLIMIAEFLVTLPFGEGIPESDRAAWAAAVNTELLLTAIPAFLITGAAAWLVRAGSAAEGLRRGAVWTAVVAALYVLIALGNRTPMFTSPGIYVLLAATLAGPVVAGAVFGPSRRRPTTSA